MVLNRLKLIRPGLSEPVLRRISRTLLLILIILCMRFGRVYCIITAVPPGWLSMLFFAYDGIGPSDETVAVVDSNTVSSFVMCFLYAGDINFVSFGIFNCTID